MIYTKDDKFAEALESEGALERNLETLRKTRKWSFMLLIFVACVFFFSVFCSLLSWMKVQQLGVMPGVASVMLFGCMQQLATILSCQNDIRTLMAFRKLKEITALKS